MQMTRNRGLFSAIVMQSCNPTLADHAISRSAPLLDRLRLYECDPSAREPLPDGHLRTISAAVGGDALDAVLLPDDARLPIFSVWSRDPSTGPVQRIGNLLHRCHNGAVRNVSEKIRTDVRVMLSESLGITGQPTKEEAARYVVRSAVRDIMFYYLCVSMMGDDRRMAVFDPLVDLLRVAVPIGTTAIQSGIWLLQRP